MVADASCPNQSPYATSHTWKPGRHEPGDAKLLQVRSGVDRNGHRRSRSHCRTTSTEAEITARADQELAPKDKLTERYFSDAFILQGVENLTNILTWPTELRTTTTTR